MSDTSTFISRPVRLSCSPREFYDFSTEMGNFVQFISDDTVYNIKAEKNSLSFQVNIMGEVNLHIAEKTMYSRILYRGENKQVNDFSLSADISGSADGKAEVILTLNAELNPVLKALAEAPVKRFLSLLADQMERFTGWNVPA